MPSRTVRNVAVCAAVIALAGGIWVFNKAKAAAQTSDLVATSCSGFANDASQLIAKGGIAGTFAAGDRVHLVIYFTGADYTWEATGVFAANKAHVGGAGTFRSITWSTSTDPETSINTQVTTNIRSWGWNMAHNVPEAKYKYAGHRLTRSHGEISGVVKFEMDLEIATAGEGTIKVNTTGSTPLPVSPIVTSASCVPKTAQLVN